MAILRSSNGKDLIVTCSCGCGEGVHICIERDFVDKDNPKRDTFAYVTCLNANWYRDQNMRIFEVVRFKLKKIWAIIRNKDFYYSEILMSRNDFETFREYINEVDGNE